MAPKRSKVEERFPNLDWQLGTHLSRMKGMSPETKSFNFKLINLLLPCRERTSQLLRNNSPNCTLCPAQVSESLSHCFFECSLNSRAAQYLLDLSKIFDSSISQAKLLQFQVHTDPLYELPAVTALYSGLGLIWRNRHDRKGTSLYDIRAELECLVQGLKKSRLRKLREAGAIITSTLDNFHVNLASL